jgi:tetratricopeptide (TPR) repeat protein
MFNESLSIYHNYFKLDHVTVAWVVSHLGNAHKLLKDYDKAQKLLSQALTIYKQNYGENHTQTAGIINSLGEVSMLKGDLELAKSLFNQALNIYKQKRHPEAYISLENLSSLFLKKYEHHYSVTY